MTDAGPDPEKVRLWSARAPAYDRLCRRWQIFAALSDRLLDLLPADLAGTVLDIGAGTGLTSERVLARHPRCSVVLVDPSEAMLAIARQHLAGRPARFFTSGLDSLAGGDVRAVAAIASASMHFLDLDAAFRALARIVMPEGHVAFNLWYHHWEETATLAGMSGWQGVAHAAFLALGLVPPAGATPAPPKARTRSELAGASQRHGFEPIAEHRDEFPTPVAFGIDFEAMNADWPVHRDRADERRRLLDKMNELAEGRIEPLVATRFLFRKRS
ncbi:MAG TPA: class I SAM-dependent methyltransferase [Caldimonas sp.]|jgi:SAM-dependent methyltransferase